MPVIYNPPPSSGQTPGAGEAPEQVQKPAGSDAAPVFSVIVPACNEESTVQEALSGLIRVLEASGEPFEILVVNDGSRDGTGKVAEEVAAADPRMKVLHHERNRGLGAALRTAIADARGEYLIGSPVDSPLDADQLRAFHDTMEARASYSYFPGKGPCDIAVGFRSERSGYKWWMRFCSAVYKWMLRVAFRAWILDFNWICMYRRSVFERISIEFDGPVALPEILVKAKRAGFSLQHVPCEMKARKVGRGTVGRPSILFKTFAAFSRLWWKVTFGGSGASRAPKARRQV